MKSHSKRILSLVFALLMAFQQVMFAAQTVDLLTPAEQPQTVDLLTGEEENKTVDLLTPAEPSAPIEQPIEQSEPIIEENKETENQTVDLLTPGDDEVVPEEGKNSTTTILIGGEEEEETQDDSWDLTPAEITVPEENHDEEEKKDATFEDEEHHENAGVLPWSTDLVKPWSIYREPKKVYRPGEDLDLTELLVEIKTGRSGSLYNIEDLINDEFTTITRTRKSDGEKVRLDDKIYEDETMTIHMDGCQDLTIDFTVDENLKDEEEALEAFQENLIREEIRDGLDFSLYLIKKGERENPIVAYSLDPHKLTPIGNGVDKKLKDGPLFDLKDINSWDRFDIETIGKVKAILERSAEIENENVRKKLITQLAIWNVTSNIIPREIDATVSEIEENETTELGPELKPTDEEEVPEEKEEEPIEIIDPTTPKEEIESVKQDDEVEAVEEKTEIEEPAEEKTEAEEPVEENAQENKESEKIEEQAPVQSTVHKIVFDVREIDLPYDEVELSDEEYALYNELTYLEGVELKSEDEDLKIYEPIIEETENQYADLVTIGESDIDSIERVETEVTFDAVDYSFQNLYHTLETSSMLGFGQPRDFNVLLKATMKASRKIVEGDKFEVEILSKTLPILNGEEGRANDIQIDGKVVATAEYIAEEHKIVYTFVEDLDTDKVEIEQEFKQIKEEKAALLNMLDVSENLVLDAVRGAEGDEDSEENPDELEISPEDDNATIKLVLGNTPVKYNGYSFETKKFRLKTTMTAKAAPVWQIPEGWTFDVNIGQYLKPEYDENSEPILKPLYDPNNPSVKVAIPKYDAKNHVIKYTFIKPLNNTKTFNIDQLLAFDTEAIGDKNEIEINIVVAPKNYKVQNMPTIKVKKDDPRSEIISKFVVEEKPDFYKVLYPYMVSYVSRQSVNNETVTWDIDVDTSTLKREGLDYNSIALSLYIPNKQGLSDYKVNIEGINEQLSFYDIGDLVLFNKTIAKDTIPDNLKIQVQAQTSVERDAYSLGIRITPDEGYIQKLRKELEKKKEELKPWIGPLFTIFSYLKDPDNSTQFDNGFNLLDTRISAIAPPENGSERAVGYNDPLRSVYFNNSETRKFDIRISETLDLKNLKNIELTKDGKYISNIGNDVYAVNGTSVENLSVNNYDKPIVNIYIPKNDGTYEKVALNRIGRTEKVNETNFKNAIKQLYDDKRLLPGTIIEYEYSGTYGAAKKYLSMSLNLNEREVYNEQLLKYTNVGGLAQAQLINVGNIQDHYKIGMYVFKNGYQGSVLFKIVETGENGYCINLGKNNPTKVDTYHRKVIVEPGEGLEALEDAISKNYDKGSYSGAALLNRLKKIFFYYDKYEREHNIDLINDEVTKYRIIDARQAAIFDAVSNNGLDFLTRGYRDYKIETDQRTVQYYNELNGIINDSPELTEEQLKSVTITLYPIVEGDFQNIITGKVENPVYIEKVGQDGEPLSGAEFAILKDGEVIANWTSDGSNKDLYLKPGEYILRETKAPEGYNKIEDVSFTVEKIITLNDITIARTIGWGENKYFHSQERYTDNVIKIEPNDKISTSANGYTLKVKNNKNNFRIKKVDANDKTTVLKDAEFTLNRVYEEGTENEREELVAVKTTDESGVLEFEGLDSGKYVLRENKSPEGYEKINEPVFIEIDNKGGIRFISDKTNGSLNVSNFEVVTDKLTVTEKVPTSEASVFYNNQIHTIKDDGIVYHSGYHDFMNVKTKVINSDLKSVKSRIFLNPSTESEMTQNGIVELGNGPDRNTILTLSKNDASYVDYRIYRVPKNEKTSIDENTSMFGRKLYASGRIQGNSRDIFFENYGTKTNPKRWDGDAYIVDTIAYYDEIDNNNTEKRITSFDWKYINKNNDVESHISGSFGAEVSCTEKLVEKPGIPTLLVKNKKGTSITITKVDEANPDMKLTGAKFKIYKEDGSNEQIATTDKDGKVTFAGLETGTYIIEEIEAPKGYEKKDMYWKVLIGESNKSNVTLLNPSDNDKAILSYNGSQLITLTNKINHSLNPRDNSIIPNEYSVEVNFIRNSKKSINGNLNIELNKDDFEIVDVARMVINEGIKRNYDINQINSNGRLSDSLPLGQNGGSGKYFIIVKPKNIVSGEYKPIKSIDYQIDSNTKIEAPDYSLPKMQIQSKGEPKHFAEIQEIKVNDGFEIKDSGNRTIRNASNGAPLLTIEPNLKQVKDGFTCDLRIESLYPYTDKEYWTQLQFELDNDNFEFEFDGEKIQELDFQQYKVNSKYGTNNYTLNIKPEGDLATGIYMPIKRILVADKSTNSLLPKIIKKFDYNVSQSDKAKKIFNDNDQVQYEAHSSIQKNASNDSYLLNIGIDSKISPDRDEIVRIKLNTEDFIVEPINTVGEYNVSNGEFTSNIAANQLGNSEFRFNVTPKSNRFKKLQPISEFTIGTNEINEFSGSEKHLAYLLRQDDNEEIYPGTKPVIQQNKKGEFSFVAKNSTKGTGKIIVKKTGENGKALNDVVFSLYKVSESGSKKLVTSVTVKNGKAEFTGLKDGLYILEETKTVDGYVLDTKQRVIRIGGSDKDDVTAPQTSKDVSERFSVVMDDNNFNRLAASGSRDDRFEVVYPNQSECVNVRLKFNINNSNEDPIKPGDTFALEFDDSVDVDGIDKTVDSEFDIYGTYGKFAKAKVLGEYPNRRIIEYTVTKAADRYEAKNITAMIPVYPNRFKLLGDDTLTVRAKILSVDEVNGHIDGSDKEIFNNNAYSASIKVNYTEYFNKLGDGNIIAYMRELHADPDTKDKRFKSIAYVNPKSRPRFDKTVTLSANQRITAEHIRLYKVRRADGNPMPYSFGIDLNNYAIHGLEAPFEIKKYTYDSENNEYSFVIPNDGEHWISEDGIGEYGSDSAYVMEVDGTVTSKELTEFRLKHSFEESYKIKTGNKVREPIYENGYLLGYVWKDVWNKYTHHWDWETWSEFYFPDAHSDDEPREISVDIENHKNKIEFTKVDRKIKEVKPSEKSEQLKPAGFADMFKPVGAYEGAVSSGEDSSNNNYEDAPLKGVKFILKKDGKEVQQSERESDENGKFGWEGLAPGKYEVWETEPQKGYEKPSTAVATFTVDENGEITVDKNTTIIINKKYMPDIKFKKIDGRNKNPLEGAEFTLYKKKEATKTNDESEKTENDEDGEKVNPTEEKDEKLEFEAVIKEVVENEETKKKPYTVTSAKDGTFKFEKLEDGIYAVKETKVPEGYVLLTKYVFFFKVEGGKIYKINEYGKYVDMKDIIVKNDKKDEALIVNTESGIKFNAELFVENFKAEYPHTGGVGALPFVFIGMMIMMVGAYMFIRRRDALYE
ncbi:MAG: SpaA isopeptide-forming pilin-related protein [Eubacteriales bacterium]|nr:SpaA isopeptide-forming pilin-related protein [Eubacteriales bacterium]